MEIMYDMSCKDENIRIGHTEIHATEGRQWRYSSEDNANVISQVDALSQFTH